MTQHEFTLLYFIIFSIVVNVKGKSQNYRGNKLWKNAKFVRGSAGLIEKLVGDFAEWVKGPRWQRHFCINGKSHVLAVEMVREVFFSGCNFKVFFARIIE